MDRLHIRQDVRRELGRAGVYSNGIHFIVDGQYGSTGKGLMASVYAEGGGDLINMVTTNAGPNSGHTAFDPWTGNKIVTQQIPVAAVVLRCKGLQPRVFLNAGAVIDPDILVEEYGRWSLDHLRIHGNAAIIEQCDREAEGQGPVAGIATTGKGVGAALARKIMRTGNVASMRPGWWRDRVIHTLDYDGTVLVETAQGFSLSVNGPFYPYTTSRDCSVLQAAADAQVSWRNIGKVIACYRTYPIRVGNTDKGTSGPCYPDQHELTWEKLGLEPELTTVTKRVRRVFSWSRQQFRDSLAVNQPHVVFLNFAQYLSEPDLIRRIEEIEEDYLDIMGEHVPLLLLGFGPYNGDVRLSIA